MLVRHPVVCSSFLPSRSKHPTFPQDIVGRSILNWVQRPRETLSNPRRPIFRFPHLPPSQPFALPRCPSASVHASWSIDLESSAWTARTAYKGCMVLMGLPSSDPEDAPGFCAPTRSPWSPIGVMPRNMLQLMLWCMEIFQEHQGWRIAIYILLSLLYPSFHSKLSHVLSSLALPPVGPLSLKSSWSHSCTKSPNWLFPFSPPRPPNCWNDSQIVQRSMNH